MVAARTTGSFASLTALVLLGTLITVPAAAVPNEDDVARSRAAERSTSAEIAALEIGLAEVSTQAEETGLRAQVANETYLRAVEDLAAAKEQVAQAQEQAAAARAELEVARHGLGEIAVTAYRGGGPLSNLQPFLSAEGFTEVMARSTTVRRLGVQADEQVQRFEALRQVASTLGRRAEEAVTAREDAAASLERSAEEARSAADLAATQLSLSGERREQLIRRLADERSTTVELERRRQQQLEEERRQRQSAAAEQAAAEPAAAERGPAARPEAEPAPRAGEERAATDRAAADRVPSRSNDRTPAPPADPTREPSPTRTPTREPSPTPAPTRTAAPTPTPAPTRTAAPTPEPPPVTSAAQQALSWARSQLGKPYGWGAAGPNSYDCSGLTMQAYAHAGRSLPRTSQSQYWGTARLSAAQLRPGDLIFYSSNGAPSGIYHVALYAGGSNRVHAPSPGSSVEEVPIWSTDRVIGYGRVR